MCILDALDLTDVIPRTPSGTLEPELNSMGGILCPGPRNLTWRADPHTLPFYRLFFFPNLTHFSLTYSFYGYKLPGTIALNLNPVVLELDPLPLRSWRLRRSIPAQASQANRVLRSAVSSAVLRCGPSLTTLSVSVPLYNLAVQHTMQLPRLHLWGTTDGSPRIFHFQSAILSNCHCQIHPIPSAKMTSHLCHLRVFLGFVLHSHYSVGIGSPGGNSRRLQEV